MIEQLIEQRREVNSMNRDNSTAAQRDELRYAFHGDLDKFLRTLETPKYYEGVRLPDYHHDMPKLETNKTNYENCSRWFMQMGWSWGLCSILDLMIAHPEGKTFLDVGSGTGNMVALANEIGLKGSGVEGSEVLPKLIPQLQNLDIHIQDFFTFEKYNDYDLIYMWNPNPPRMNELGKLVTGQITKKTAIVGLTEPALGNPKGAISKSELDASWSVFDRAILKNV
jgi:hypothetical protein